MTKEVFMCTECDARKRMKTEWKVKYVNRKALKYRIKIKKMDPQITIKLFTYQVLLW
jgi:hypothetical protein